MLVFRSGRYIKENLKLFLILTFINVFIPTINYSQTGQILQKQNNILFENLGLKDGLSSTVIISLLQDHQGFIWIGTPLGINRYDGYTFKEYKHHPQKNPGLGKGSVHTIFEDSRNNLWFGTDKGLSLYNRHNETFTLFQYVAEDSNDLGHNIIFKIAEKDSNSLLLGTKDGLNYFDYRQNKIFPLFKATEHQNPELKYHIITDIKKDSAGKLWLATSSGVYFQDKTAIPDSHFTRLPETGTGSILTIAEDRGKMFWFGSWGKGLFHYNPQTGALVNFIHDPENLGSLCSDKVFTLHEDNNGLIWIGTANGLSIYDPDLKSFNSYYSEKDDSYSLSSHYINKIFQDKTHLIWIGTSNGLNKYSPSKSVFNHFKISKKQTESAVANYITSICESPAGAGLWIGSFAGLNVLNKNTGNIKTYYSEANNPNSLVSQSITSMTFDKDKMLWIGTQNGLCLYDPENERFTQFHKDKTVPGSLSNNFIYKVYTDNSGEIWIGTWGGGLNRFDKASYTFEHYKHDPDDRQSLANNDVRDIFYNPDDPNKLWLATFAGLELFDKNTKKVRLFKPEDDDPKSLIHHNVLDLLVDHAGTLWIGTMGGLNRFNAPDETFEHFDDELLNKEILGITEDQNYNLWLVIPGGLVRFDPKTLSAKLFTTDDGLRSDQLVGKAGYKSESGQLFFGGTDGVNYFHPNDILNDPFSPDVVFTEMAYFHSDSGNKSIKVPGISAQKSIGFSYKHNIFTIEFAALNFNQPLRNKYSYKLDGLNENWINNGTKRDVTFSNLNPGEHTLYMKAANKDDVWNDKPVSLKIYIDPPWWQSAWAYLIYIVFFISGLIALRRYELNRQSYKYNLQLEKVEAAKLKELDTLKSRFFANISHEFRTPLTLILGQIDNLMTSETTEKTFTKLQMASRNGKRLLRLINQLLDLSKIEAAGITLNVTRKDFIPFLKNLVFSFESLTEKNGIELIFSSNKPSIDLYFDPEKLEKVFLNLISNAVKFTEKGGKISIDVKLNKDESSKKTQAVISIEDTGIGIPHDRLNHIFDRFYQVDSSQTRAYEGTGIGLALAKELVELHFGKISVHSDEGKGSTFTVILPTDPALFNVTEKDDQSSYSDVNSELSKLEFELLDNDDSKMISANEAESEKKQTILVVDDNADIRSYISEQLENEYAILEAREGESGLHIARDVLPDLIITDVMMPRMDGYTFSKAIREDTRSSHIPIIMLTARADEADKIEGLQTGVDDYLIKPFSTKELVVRVKNLLEMRARLRKKFKSALVIKPEEVSIIPADQKFMEQVISEIQLNISNVEFSAQQLADNMAMSVRTLTRKLNSLIDQSPAHFIRSVRLNSAAELLKVQAGTISEIAYQVGFSDQAHFTRTFKKEFNQSPSEYIRANKDL